MLIKTLCYAVRHPIAEPMFQRKFCSIADAVCNTQLNELPHYSTRVLRVAIIGTPNAGKSTLINNLMDRKVIGVQNIFFSLMVSS